MVNGFFRSASTNPHPKVPIRPLRTPEAEAKIAQPDYSALAQQFADWWLPLVQLPERLAYVEDLAAPLRAGQRLLYDTFEVTLCRTRSSLRCETVRR